MAIKELIYEELINQWNNLITSKKEVYIPFCTYNMVEEFLNSMGIYFDTELTWSENSQDWSVRDISNTYFISGNKWNGGVQIQYIPDDEKDR